MSHSHEHHAGFGRAFAIGVILNSGFVLAEVVFGLLGHSLTLLADAGHNLGDVLGLLMAWAASNWENHHASDRYTYGWRRSSVLAALFNAILLLVSVGAITWEAIHRLVHPEAIAGLTIMRVAAFGIVVNGVTAWMFARGRHSDLNIRGAFLHMAADAGISVGVVATGFLILQTGWTLIDPIGGLTIVAIILFGTWGLLRDSLNLSLDAVPREIDLPAVRQWLESLPEVAALHHLHVWGLSTTEVACTAHVVKREPELDDELLRRIADGLHDRFGIEHTTVQFESCRAPDCPMESENASVPHGTRR